VVGGIATKTITIDNLGDEPLSIDDSSISLPAGFSLAAAPESSVPAGGSTALVVALDTSAVASDSGVLSFANGDASNSLFSVAISGVVLAAMPGLALYGNAGLIAAGASDSFGSTGLGKAVYQPYTIENTGASTITIDPASIALPAGFSVATPPAASLDPGGTTSLIVRLDATSAGAAAGALSLNYNDGAAETYTFNISGAVTAAEPLDVSIDQFGLASGLNTLGAGPITTADPTLSGVIDGTFNAGNVVVELAVVAGSGDPVSTGTESSLPAVTASGASFAFDPRTADATLVGYVGPVSVAYRALVYDAAGALSQTLAWTDYNFTIVAPPSAVEADNVRLADDTGDSSSDLLTYDPTVTGTINGPLAGASVDVQFVVGDGLGNPSGTLGSADTAPTGVVTVTSSGAAFDYNPADDDPALINYTGTVTLNYRLVERDASGGALTTGAWTPISFTLYAPTPQASVTDLHLVDDTGSSASDLVTADPRVAGTVASPVSDQSIVVQFSNHGDGHVDGTIAGLIAGSAFAYDPRLEDPTLGTFAGTLNLAYRTVEIGAEGGHIYGPWVAFAFTLDPAASGAAVENLRLVFPLAPGEDGHDTTNNPQVTGSVVGAAGTAGVQFEIDGGSVADAMATVAGDGTFSQSLSGLAYGVVTVEARAVEWQSDTLSQAYGAWTTLTFDYEPAPAPTIASLTLADLTDPANQATTDPSLTGQLDLAAWSAATSAMIAGTPSLAVLTVEIDTNGDGVPDTQTFVNSDGSFTYTLFGLTYGGVAVAARVADHDPSLPATAYSDWTRLSFNYEAPLAPAPQISGLRLAQFTASLGDTSATSDATITGQVTYASGGAGASAATSVSGAPTALAPDAEFVTVEIDTNGDGVPDATTVSGAGGVFTYQPVGLAAGNVVIEARAVGHDAAANTIYGAWTSLAFAYQPVVNSIATVAALKLANPPASGGAASDPTVTGQVTNPTSASPTAVSALTVQIDTNGDGVADATVVTDGNGNFTFTPSGLSAGPVTVAARVLQHDYETGGFDASAWTSLAFNYQPVVAATITITSLVLASDTSGSAGVTGNPTVRGAISTGNGAPPSGSTFVEIDTGGDGVPDAVVWPDADGNFIDTPPELAYGAVTIAARPKTWNANDNSYVAGAWTTLSFTYQQQAATAPAIAALGLIDASGNLNAQVTAGTTHRPADCGRAGDLAAGACWRDPRGRHQWRRHCRYVGHGRRIWRFQFGAGRAGGRTGDRGGSRAGLRRRHEAATRWRLDAAHVHLPVAGLVATVHQRSKRLGCRRLRRAGRGLKSAGHHWSGSRRDFGCHGQRTTGNGPKLGGAVRHQRRWRG
jgi:hypothetical protein